MFYIRYAWGLLRPAVTTASRTATIITPRQTGVVNPANSGNNRGTTARPPGSEMPTVIETVQVAPQPNLEEDTLEATLKPLKPRLFHVESPIGFRRALAELLAEIGKM